jgi:lipid-binding SYLF domain-containing protein
MSYQNSRSYLFISFCLFILLFSIQPKETLAASATEINIGTDETLKRFRTKVPGGNEFLKRAKGVLVFPNVLKAGFWLGGEYGEGALRIDGQTKAYYSTAAASIGLQAGAQSKSVVLVFMTNDALVKFQQSEGWKAGVDGSVALVEWGAAEDINTIDIEDPIVGFVFSNKGLMFNLTLEGSKFTKIVK